MFDEKMFMYGCQVKPNVLLRQNFLQTDGKITMFGENVQDFGILNKNK